MNPALLAAAPDALAFALGLLAIAAAWLAATARSLFAALMGLIAAGGFVAAALLCFGLGDAALAQALAGAGVAPAVLLAALLLSARAVKPAPRTRLILNAVAAVLVAAAIGWAAFSLPDRAALEWSGPARRAAPVSAMLAPLAMAAAMACLVLLGFGERGALHHPPEPERRE